MQSGRRIAGRCVCAVGAAAAIAFAATGIGQNDEHAFIREAVQANIAEVQLGELAAQRGASEAVRQFGATLRADHDAALKRATNVAKSLSIEPPTAPATEARGMYEGLAQLSGSQFDAAFVSHMIAAHEAQIATFSRNANSDNDAVASLIAEALPKLRAHLAAAHALQKGEPSRAQQ